MTREELEAAVAEKLSTLVERTPYTPDDAEWERIQARAAIAVVVEACAEVADEYAAEIARSRDEEGANLVTSLRSHPDGEWLRSDVTRFLKEFAKQVLDDFQQDLRHTEDAGRNAALTLAVEIRALLPKEKP